MSDVTIKAENLSKKFIISHEKGVARYTAFRDVITEKVAGLFKPSSNYAQEEFWALKDVSFEVKRGDRIGIIGRNGAGKSTLLKILSRITEPSSGRVGIRGRVASLLEVGTGFHPELTGRENIFLNGAILGMSRAEIKSKMDEIIAFAEVEKFLDTPVKRYSSGMYVRLAFAVAAHLEPEILVVDEVLAVGDLEFQKKCLGKMKDVSAKEGRTVLFVSHNLTAVNSLCDSCIYLKNGQVFAMGGTEEVVNTYLNSENASGAVRTWSLEQAPGDDVARLRSARIVDENLETLASVYIHQKIGIEYEYDVLKPGFRPIPNIHIFTNQGDMAFGGAERDSTVFDQVGRFKAVMWIPENLLNTNTYVIGIALSTLSPVKVHFFEKNALVFDAMEDLGRRANKFNQKIPGIVRPALTWQTGIINGTTSI